MQYYNVKYFTDFVRLVNFNQFWFAFMEHIVSESKRPFLSNQFKYASKSYTDYVLALAVIDLPFRAGNHRYEANNRGLDITTASPLIAFYKEIIEDEKEELEEDIMILQRYFEANDRYQFTKNNKKIEKYVTKFYANRVYGCQIVVTNFSKKKIKSEVMSMFWG